MSQILSGAVLWDSTNDDEAADLARIREMYIPELVIAYNTVLCTAGSVISRLHFIESMDLSVTIAAKESEGIAALIVKAGRMRELVRSFAVTSKAMLIQKDAGKEWKPKRDRRGRDLGMWEIGPQVLLSGVEGLNVGAGNDMQIVDGEAEHRAGF
jgi:nuclear pore complex protein Nup107